MAIRSRSRVSTLDSFMYEACAVDGKYLLPSSTSARDIQSRYVFAPAPGHFETREVALTHSFAGGAASVTDSMTDSLGCKSRFNSCLHVRRIPITVAFVPANGQVQPWQQSFSWIKIGQVPGQVHGKVYPSVLESTWPAVSLPTVDWSQLTAGISDDLNGHMDASTNMLVNVAQLSQTVGMLKNPLGLLRRNWRTAAKRLTAGSLARDSANMWLEYRYGWSNLYRDIRAVARLRDDVRRHIDYLRRIDGSWASVSRKVTDVASPMSGRISLTGSGFNTVEWTLDSVKRTCCVSCDVYRERLLDRLTFFELTCQRLGLSSWVEAAWDLVPFSFVVDWFIDIGGIGKWDPILSDSKRVRQAGYSVKTEYTAHVQYKSGFEVYNSPTTKQAFSSQWTSNPQVIRKTYERNSGFPSSLTPPRFFSGLNLIHATDGIALIAQRIR